MFAKLKRVLTNNKNSVVNQLVAKEMMKKGKYPEEFHDTKNGCYYKRIPDSNNYKKV